MTVSKRRPWWLIVNAIPSTFAFVFAFAFIALLGAATGCDDTKSKLTAPTDGGAPPEITGVDLFAEEMGAAVCRWEFRCCSLPEIDALGASSYLTESACKIAVAHGLKLRFSTLRAAVAQGRLIFDPALAKTCLDQLGDTACNSSFAPALFPSDRVNQCVAPFTGTKPVDTECSLAYECAPGSSCYDVAHLAESPLPSNAARGRPLLGDMLSSLRGTCQKDGREGAFCLMTSECAPGLYCRTTDYVCARPAAEGEPCSVLTSESGEAIATFSTCAESPQPLVCVQSVCRRMPRAGEPCLLVLGELVCGSAPGEPLACVGQSFNGVGICKPLAKRGEACAATDGIAPCGGALACKIEADVDPFSAIGTCEPPPQAGQPCSIDGRCAPSAVCYAPTNICVVPGMSRSGAACQSDYDCATVNCIGGSALRTGPGVCAPAPFGAVCVGPGNSAVTGMNPPQEQSDAGMPTDSAGISSSGGRTGGGGRTGTGAGGRTGSAQEGTGGMLEK